MTALDPTQLQNLGLVPKINPMPPNEIAPHDEVMRLTFALENVAKDVVALSKDMRELSCNLTGDGESDGIFTRLKLLEDRHAGMSRMMWACVGAVSMTALGGFGALLWWAFEKLTVR